MLLPVKEAKFKHCPYLTSPDGKLRFCMVDSCMMWRFKHPAASGGEQGETALGYCGLAGKPVGAM